MTDFPNPEQLEHDVLHALADFRGARVLEIGAGDGRMIRHYLRETALTVALDSDWDELIAARAESLKDTNARLAHGQAERLPFSESSFDLAVFGWSL
ncbi:MAG: methyltransferase domain-containing protein [Chloroflexi bacterium]|nr:methyltransferase domain-containing protein [Chloroflexota bacterium]